MSAVILGRDKEVAEWAWARMPPGRHRLTADYTAIGFSEGNAIVAAAVFHDYRNMPFGADIQLGLAIAAPRFATRGNIRVVLSYPFRQLKVVRLTCVTGRKMKRMRKFIEGMGCHLEGVHRRAYDGRQDAITYALYPEDAERWLKEKD